MQLLNLFILAGTLSNLALLITMALKIESALQPVVALGGALSVLTLEVERLANRISLMNVVGDRATDAIANAANSQTASFVKAKVERVFDKWKNKDDVRSEI